MDPRRTYAVPVIAAVLLLLPLLYVVSYLLLVVPAGCPTRRIVEWPLARR